MRVSVQGVVRRVCLVAAVALGVGLSMITTRGTVRAAAFLPPGITLAFGAPTIPLNSTTSLTFTISNSDPALPLTGVGFTDTLPSGLVVATPSGATGTCNGGTLTATAGASSITLTGGTLPVSSSCVLTVNVKGITAGLQLDTATPSATETGPGSSSFATVQVMLPPTIGKLFNVPTLPVNGGTVLLINLGNNAQSGTLTGVGFTDVFPAGIVVSTPSSVVNLCGGTVTAVAGSNSVALTGGTISGLSSCTMFIDITATTSGTKVNTTGNVTSLEGGTGGTATASMDVLAPPGLSKSFSPAQIPLNGTTTLTFTLTNPNPDPLTAVSFSDTLPLGLIITTPGVPILCNGLASITSSGVSFSGASMAANSTCQFSVPVQGTATGNYVNTTSAVTSAEVGNGSAATANLQVGFPMTIAKAFQSPAIPVGVPVGLTFTISNQTSATQHNVSFTDTLPAGQTVANPNSFTGGCTSGATLTLVATPGAATISGVNDTYAPGASCTFTVNVISSSVGVKLNSVVVTSAEGGISPAATAQITIDPTVPAINAVLLIAIAGMLLVVGVALLRRRRTIA